MDNYVNLILKTKSRMTDRLYTYKIPDGMDVSLGQRVLVPFGKGDKKYLAIVVEFVDPDNLSKTIKYKEIYKELETSPILNKEMLAIAKYMVDQYLSDLSSSISTVLPPGNIVRITEMIKSTNQEDDLTKFTEQARTYEEVRDKFPQIRRKDLKILKDKGLINIDLKIDSNRSIKTIKYISLTGKEEKLSKRAFRQKKVIDFLKTEGVYPYTKLLKKTGASSSTIKSLEEKGLVKSFNKEVYRKVLEENIEYKEAPELSKDQLAALEQIESGEKTTYLLKGVTGSGKTEIYLNLVEKTIKQGKKAIVLVPEISLTPQTIKRFVSRFGKKVAVLHSKLSVNERFDQWRMIREGRFDIVVGTRSAIFAPVKNLGLVIIDEEHELSYVNENNPKYDAIDIGRFRAEYNNCKLILATATPRVESYYHAKKGDYQLVELKKRIGKNLLPEVFKVDMRQELKEGNYSMFSESLKEAISTSLEEKKQSILFLNKRGHSSYIFCRKCGYVLKCDACDVSLTYHKNKDIAICHLCGRTKRMPLLCPQCGSNAIKEFGAGTQKLEEVTKETFPTARVFRMDADTMAKKGAYERVYEKMQAGKIDILIGTQMLSKGFDFKNVSVVGVMAADLSLNIPDFRSQEKTFQLITQVAGRAGRGGDRGKVFIQTYQADNPAIAASQYHDYESFYKKEIENRLIYKYPPFYRLILIRVSHPSEYKARKRSLDIIKRLKVKMEGLDSEIIGPNPAVISKINNNYRFNTLIRTKDSIEEIKAIVDREVIRNKRFITKGYKTYVMVDPNSLY